jgi:hypothetical protein
MTALVVVPAVKVRYGGPNIGYGLPVLTEGELVFIGPIEAFAYFRGDQRPDHKELRLRPESCLEERREAFQDPCEPLRKQCHAQV